MQVFIARLLNRLLAVTALAAAALGAGIYYVYKQYPDALYFYLAGYFLLILVLTVLFKWLENSWDKSVIIKMARAGKIAFFNIEQGRRFLPLRDTAFNRYWIFEIEGILYDGEHHPVKKTFYEKMNRTMEAVPSGSVYVTYDSSKPKQIFIVPNALIGSLPDLKALVDGYEKDPKIAVNYLDVHYNKGMVLRTFKDAVREYREKTEKEESGEQGKTKKGKAAKP